MQGRASASVKGCWPSQTRHSRERLHSPGMISHGRSYPDPGEQDGGRSRWFRHSRLVSRYLRGSFPTGYDLSESRCTTPAGCKTICIAAYSDMYDSRSGFTD